MWGRIQLSAGLLVLACGVAYPIAYAASRFLHVNFAGALAAISVVFLSVVIVLFHFLRRMEVQTPEMKESQIHSMDIAAAAAAAQAILSDASKFVVVRRHADDFPFANEMAQHLRAFFAEVESLKAVRGDAELTRSSITRSDLNRNYIRIGRDIESVEINIRPSDETVYEFDAFDSNKPFDQHCTIYHWVLAVDRAIYGD